jgi:hypothetical protein
VKTAPEPIEATTTETDVLPSFSKPLSLMSPDPAQLTVHVIGAVADSHPLIWFRQLTVALELLIQVWLSPSLIATVVLEVPNVTAPTPELTVTPPLPTTSFLLLAVNVVFPGLMNVNDFAAWSTVSPIL